MALLSRAIGPSVSRRMRLIPEFDYGWEWVLPASREALWPLVSDTNRFNRDTGMPTLAVAEAPGAAAASGRRRLRAARLGLGLEWEEEPFEWIRPQRFAVVRRYLRGPVAEVSVRVELAAEGDAATRLRYEVRAKARTALGLLAIPLQIGVLSARRFRAVFYRYAELAAAQERAGLQLPPAARARLAPGGRERLASLRAKLIERTDQPELVARLVDLVECGDDVVLARLRPYALADAWRAPRRALLELCLHASRIGLLDLQWDLICPHCRGAQQTAGTLGDLECDCHCTACNVDFAANFEQSVELTFRPNPAVRPVVAYAFCVGGPQVTPHIVVQQRLDPGEVRMLRPALEAGRYRLRTLTLPGGVFLTVTAGGAGDAVLRASAAGWADQELELGARPALHFDNGTDREQLFILERTAWSDQATTAAEVTALQEFRDLFAGEALRPGEQISVGSLAVLFTDLRGSTRLYREIGDAPAFGRVMSHFDVLREAIAPEEGALVKMIGDAVMAVFRRPAGALRAILSAQKMLAMPADGGLPLVLKAGLHYGPCIAVTLNERLDYFGSTVNLAARLDALSGGGDIVISEVVRCDPEVLELLAQGGLEAEPFEARLRGFEEEPARLWRVRPASSQG